MQPGWCQPVRQEFIENECEALPGVAYPGVRDNRSTINTKTGYDDDDDDMPVEDDVDIWRYAIVSCMPETTTCMYVCTFQCCTCDMYIGR